MEENVVISPVVTDDGNAVDAAVGDSSPQELSGISSVSDGDASVSGGDSVVYLVDNSVEQELLLSISDDVQLLADATTEGYLSSSIVAVFDRVVDSNDFKYYVAFRGSADSSEGYLYLSNQVNGSTLSDCTVVHMYRTYVDSSTGYQYYYQVSADASESFNFGSGAMYYTNLIPGYPTLGNEPVKHQSVWLAIIAMVIFVCSFFIRRKIKEC